jgi:multiple sugar transport system ATP-binding protein
MARLGIHGVRKRYGPVDVLKHVDIDLEDGEFLVLLGPSGCGKSTLLNIIAGLTEPSAGEIRIGDRVVNDVHPKDRDIAMVFQSYALYPNMNVARNMAFGLEMRGMARAERDAAVAKVAKLLQIEHLLARRPSQLSGGQRQRVAIGRALVREPKVFLFDEPLSNLDAKLRVETRTEIKRLHQRLGTTIVYVTHDQIEAMTLASRIAIMKDGVVQQFDTPNEIYRRPANLFVAGFIGSPPMNFIRGRIQDEGGRLGLSVTAMARGAERSYRLPLASGSGAPGSGALGSWAGREVVLGIRPEAIDLAAPGQSSESVVIEADIDVIEPTGADTLAYLRLGGSTVVARLDPLRAEQAGAVLSLAFDMSRASLFDPETEARIP